MWPSIKKVAIDMAYDNDAINRYESEEALLAKLDTWLTNHKNKELLDLLETTLEKMTEIERKIIAFGDTDISHGIMVRYAKGWAETAEALLKEIFDAVICSVE